jgi:hypothetical protein
MMHIIHSTVMKHLDMHGILVNAQHGFQKCRSCESQIIMTLHHLANSPNRNEPVDGMRFYFSKAFDKVPHQRLLEKLSYYKVRGYLHSWTKDFLTNRKQEVLSPWRQGRQENIWAPGQEETWPPPPILQIMILKLSPPWCVISKESVQQKWIDELWFRKQFFYLFICLDPYIIMIWYHYQ